ncbi:MAG: hypothetical protein OXL97_06215 [Chloroflexota bacterium]|nr:hypothetical protein [Chloroflexota bacterium]MDE2885427.1 hypothetical protein [Chloroflexota bacterium]
MVEPTIRLEESTAPGRAHDLDVYANDVRLGSIRPVGDRGFIAWRWHFGAALADPALELGRVCEREDGHSRNQWEAALTAWAAFLTKAEWEETLTVVYTEEIVNTLHIHALYVGRILERMQKMKPRSGAAAKAIAVLQRHRHEMDDAVSAIGMPPPGEEWHPMPEA